MRDFTLELYKWFLKVLKDQGYNFIRFDDYISNPSLVTRYSSLCILRHDVDRKPENALRTAIIENELGIKGTYYFRIVPESFDEKIIREIAGLRHEVGYHYEEIDLVLKRKTRDERREILRSTQNDPPSLTRSRTKDNEPQQAAFNKPPTAILDEAWDMFKKNVEKINKVADIRTTCPHGSPLSPFSNRIIWDKYDYKELGILGDAVLDTNWNEIAYFTDTGRRWDGNDVSVRDKAPSSILPQSGRRYRTTFDIIEAIEKDHFPKKAMLTVHPQRWTDDFIPWVKELVYQNVKNVVKKIIVRRDQRQEFRN